MILLLAAFSGCGSNDDAARPPATVGPTVAPPTPAVSGYDLHEWGVVAIRPGSFEVAAGAGQRAPEAMAVDKPVLYVHPASSDPFELRLTVTTAPALSVVEHFPPTGIAPLTWTARVSGTCEGIYPAMQDSRCPDGYCEIGELRLYEADGACLDVAGARAPLLFYRLWAPGGTAPAMPLAVTRERSGVTVSNGGLRDAPGHAWRITWTGTVTRVAPVTLPAVGSTTPLPTADGDVQVARRTLRADLREQGLTEPETDAFMRGWDAALFGEVAASDSIPADDQPVPPPSDRSSAVDELSRDDGIDLPGYIGGPRVRDALVYWLPADAIDSLARIEATPPPREVRRVFLVRHAF